MDLGYIPLVPFVQLDVCNLNTINNIFKVGGRSTHTSRIVWGVKLDNPVDSRYLSQSQLRMGRCQFFNLHQALSQLHRLRSMSLWWHCWLGVSRVFGSKTWLLCCSPKFEKSVCSLDLFLFPVKIQTDDALVDDVGGIQRRDSYTGRSI